MLLLLLLLVVHFVSRYLTVNDEYNAFIIGEEHQLHQERKQTKKFIILNLYSLSFLARTVTRNARCGLRTF